MTSIRTNQILPKTDSSRTRVMPIAVAVIFGLCHPSEHEYSAVRRALLDRLAALAPEKPGSAKLRAAEPDIDEVIQPRRFHLRDDPTRACEELFAVHPVHGEPTRSGSCRGHGVAILRLRCNDAGPSEQKLASANHGRGHGALAGGS